MRKPYIPELLRSHSHVFIAFSPKEYHEVLKKYGFDETSRGEFIDKARTAQVSFLENRQFGRLAVVSFQPTEDITYDLGTIVHESVHVWQNMMAYIEEDSPGNEIEAYGIENLCRYFFSEYFTYMISKEASPCSTETLIQQQIDS